MNRNACQTVLCILCLTLLVCCAKNEAQKREGMEERVITEAQGAEEKKVEDAGGMPVVLMKTSLGEIRIELDRDKAPISVANFLQYVADGFYDGTIFHRVISTFMIQGGGFEPGMTQKAVKDPIKNEAGNGLRNLRGTIAMARTGVVDSATAQFFINVVDNGRLDHKDETARGFGYAVFGRVIEGMETVDKIRAVETGTSDRFRDVPTKDVVIESVTVLE